MRNAALALASDITASSRIGIGDREPETSWNTLLTMHQYESQVARREEKKPKQPPTADATCK
jgi:hypothetical protein